MVAVTHREYRSIAGRCALAGSAPYDASKFAIEAISDALRMELVSSGNLRLAD